MLAALDNSSAIFRIAVVLVTLMAACIACLVVALWMRRWVKDSGPARPNVGFTLSDLRQMYKSGHLTAEEFEKAKQKIVVAAQRSLLAANKGKPPVGPLPPADPAPPESHGGGGAV